MVRQGTYRGLKQPPMNPVPMIAADTSLLPVRKMGWMTDIGTGRTPVNEDRHDYH
jgi:hypothetical protein